MKRTGLKILENENRDGYNIIITEVIANGIPFMEYYIGVPKHHNFYCNKSTMRYDKDIRGVSITTNVFNRRTFSPRFNTLSELENSKLNCIDGAYLSFARLGQSESTKDEYSFLKENYFYYGGAFQIRERIKDYDSDSCLKASYEIINKMINYLNVADIMIPPDRTIEEIKEFVLKTNIIPEKIYNVNPKIAMPISIFKKETSYIGLYDYDQIKGTIYCLGDTNIRIDSNFNIFYKEYDGFDQLVYPTYIEALVAKTKYFPLNKTERMNLLEILQNKKDYKIMIEEE